MMRREAEAPVQLDLMVSSVGELSDEVRRHAIQKLGARPGQNFSVDLIG